MDTQTLERIIYEEVQKALQAQQRSEQTLLPPSQTETLDANACKSPACTVSTNSPVQASSNQTSSNQASQPNPQSPLQPNPTPVALQANKPTTPPVEKTGPKILVIFSGAKEAWEPISRAFEKWSAEGFQLDAMFSSSARDVLNVDELQKLGFRAIDRPTEVREIMYNMKRYSAVFLPSMSRTHAAKLALGITDTITLNLTLASLAQGVPTFASNEGMAPTACIVCGNNVPGIQDVLDNYRNQLSKMGLQHKAAHEIVDDLYAVVSNKAKSGPDLIKTLITEEDAAKLNGPVVKVARGGLVTPLAMEQFIKRGIEVQIVPQKD